LRFLKSLDLFLDSGMGVAVAVEHHAASRRHVKKKKKFIMA